MLVWAANVPRNATILQTVTNVQVIEIYSFTTLTSVSAVTVQEQVIVSIIAGPGTVPAAATVELKPGVILTSLAPYFDQGIPTRNRTMVGIILDLASL